MGEDNIVDISVDLNGEQAEKSADKLVKYVEKDFNRLEARANNLKKEINRIFDTRADQESPVLVNLEKQLKEANTGIDKMIQRLIDIGTSTYMTDEFKHATDSLERWEEKYDRLVQSAINRRQKALAQAEGQKEYLYGTMLEATGTGDDVTADQLKQYQDLEALVNRLTAEIAQMKTQFASGVPLDDALQTKGIAEASERITEFKNKVDELKADGRAYIAGADTPEYQKVTENLDKQLDKTSILITRTDERAEKEAKAAQDIVNAKEEEEATKAKLDELAKQRYEELLQRRELALQKEIELRTQTVTSSQEEANAVDMSVQDQIRAYEAEIKEIDRLIAQKEKAQEIAERHNASYNRVRESLMGIQSTTRGIARLIPGLNTSAIYGITSITRGVARLASLSKDELVGAINNVKQSYGKLIAFITSHPIIMGAIAAIGALIAMIVALKNMFDKIRESMSEFLETVGDIAKDIGERAVNLIADGLKLLTKSFAKLSTVSIRILIFSLQNLVDAVKSVMSVAEDTYKLLVKLNNGINDINLALSNLTSSLDYLEGAFSTAFSPILLYVEPVLTRFIDLTGDAMNAVGMLFAKLLGQDSYTKVIRKQEDFNESLKKTGKRAKESLAPFDKLNVISKQTGKDKKDDDLDVDFEEIDLSLMTMQELIDSFAQEGYNLGKTLNDTLESIEWDEFITNAGLAGTAIAEFINQFFSHPNLGAELGELFGNAINAVSEFIANLFGDGETGIDVDNLADQFVSFIKRAIKAFDPEKVAKAITNMVKKIVRFIKKTIEGITPEDIQTLANKLGKTLRTALQNIPWEDITDVFVGIGGKLATFFNGIMTTENVTAVADAIANAFNSVMSGISEFANKLQWSQIGSALANGINTFFATWDFKATGKALNNIASGILKMLKTAIVGEEYEAILTADLRKQTLRRGGLDWNVIAKSLLSGLQEIKWNELVSDMVDISKSLMEGITTILYTIRDDPEMSKEIFEALAKLWVEKEKWEELGEDLVEYLEDGVASTDVAKSKVFKDTGEAIANVLIDNANNTIGKWQTPTTAVEKVLAKALVDDFSNIFFDAGEDLGESNVEGVIKGLGCITDAVYQETLGKAMSSISGSVTSSAKEELEINSPSKLMAREVGLPILEGILNGITGYVGSDQKISVATSLSTWWDNIIAPFIKKVGTIWSTISKTTKPLLTEYKRIVKEKNVALKDDLKSNNSAIKTNFIDTWTKIGTGIKSPLQSIINVFASFTDKIIDCTNSMITNLNTLKIDMPEWLTGATSAQTFSFGLSKISHVEVPKLAQGTVIPPNMSQFLAVLGDNNRETEVVSPLSTIEQALRNVLTEQNVNVTFQIEGDPHGMFRVVQKEATSYTKRTGRLAF